MARRDRSHQLMATTTNFGWETPDDTDLVKDGALAMRTLGNAIDTSLVDLKGGTTGQVLSKTSNTDMDFTWVTSDDANAIQNTIVDAKGDLITATGSDVPARLAVGNNGDTLLADSSTSTGLRWQPTFAAGKNAIINGDFYINQRSFTSTTTTSTYGQDRWQLLAAGGTSTYSAENFTAGAAPVAGYEGKSFARLVSTGQSAAADRTVLTQRIENVRTFAGQTVTLSFWAKASTGTPSVAADFAQGFGTGGSSTVNVTGQKTAITSSWARYSLTFAIPSISGKTIGTGTDQLQLRLWTSAGSDWNTFTNTLGIQSVTIDIWGVQVEAGSVATAFQTATGTLQGELAAAQRYYYRYTADGNNRYVGNGFARNTTQSYVTIPFLVTMRTRPTALEQSGTAADYGLLYQATATNLSAVPAYSTATTDMIMITADIASGLTAGDGLIFRISTSGAYLGWSAEL